MTSLLPLLFLAVAACGGETPQASPAEDAASDAPTEAARSVQEGVPALDPARFQAMEWRTVAEDPEGAGRQEYTNLLQDNLALSVDPAAGVIYLGVARADLGDPEGLRLVVAVGSNQSWNDDIPGSGAARVNSDGM